MHSFFSYFNVNITGSEQLSNLVSIHLAEAYCSNKEQKYLSSLKVFISRVQPRLLQQSSELPFTDTPAWIGTGNSLYLQCLQSDLNL